MHENTQTKEREEKEIGEGQHLASEQVTEDRTDGGQVFAAQGASKPAEYASSLVRRFASMPVWVPIVALVLLVATIVPMGTVEEVPDGMVVGQTLRESVDRAVDWMVVKWDPIFSAINRIALRYMLLPLENWLQGLPWWLSAAVVTFLAYRLVSRNVALATLASMLAIVSFGLFDHAMSTLSLVIVATAVSAIVGVPTGILSAKSTRFNGAVRPVLDTMQTMPPFVYLVPVLMLFGLGKVPAVIATFIYAVPPIIRLTDLGIRQVDRTVVEAARSFGTSGRQMLVKVEMPLAMPTIMAGLNQTIMMALAMVVLASMIGAKGLGAEVLNGIARLEVGRGLLGGIGIVIMAIILDRITQSFGKTKRPTART